MGNGCCCCRKKVAPLRIPTVTVSEAVEHKVVKKDKPYGYVRLYAGVRTGDDRYSSPVISLHRYNKARKVATLRAENGQLNGNGFHPGPSNSTNTDRHEIDENVRCIPVEDIISIEYSTDIKKEYETFETIRERPRPPSPKLKCCGQVKRCLRKTFCRCPSCPCKKCKPPPEERPQFDTNTTQNVIAKRMILIDMKCIQHSNIDIPSHVQALPNDEKAKFYTDNFIIDDSVQFYLVNNNETEQNNFEAKRNQAENFCRIIVQLRNMKNFPSPAELEEILKQQATAIFGDEIHE